MRVGLTIRLFTPNTGGLQLHAAHLMDHLAKRGHQVVIVTRALSKVPSFQELFWFTDETEQPSGSNVVLLRPSRFFQLWLWVCYKCCGRPQLRKTGIFLYELAYLKKTISAFRGCDVVHHVGQGSEMIGFAGEAAARHLGLPFVIQPTIHPGQWGDSPIDFELYRKADRILAYTYHEQAYFVDHGFSQPVDVVGSGIDDRQDGVGLRFRDKYAIAGFLILFLGRKERDKGYFLLREAFQRLAHHATLVCIGPGKGMPGLDKGLDGKRVVELDFAGEPEKHDALAACDIFCVPSEGEAFGLVFMEAAHYGKPVVCCRLPVLEELLPQGAAFVGTRDQNGRLVTDPVELAECLDLLMGDELRRKTLGRGGAAASQAFLWPKVAERFCQSYENALHR